jgi:putative ABC transport system permease protein
MARKLFDSIEVLGRTFTLENTWDLTVTGVIADIPDNSHLGIDLIVGMDTAWAVLDFDYSFNWYFTNFYTYVLLEEGASSAGMLTQLRSVTAGQDQNPLFAEHALDFSAYALRDIHLNPGREGEMRSPGSLNFVLTFSAIAACLLLIACINFMNLSTARASTRVREVGMRKTLGATRGGLIVQFLGEALLFTGIALIVALAVIELLLPLFSVLVERPLQFAALFRPGFFAFGIAVTLCTALIAGAYPAFYLSGFNPARVLKPDTATFAGGIALRNILVVVQFFLAITLIVATLVVYIQMQFVKNSELGFRRDNVVLLTGTNTDGLGAGWPALKQQLLQQGGVSHVAEAAMIPRTPESRSFRAEGGAPGGMILNAHRVGFGFFATYDIPLLAGRYLDERFATDVFHPPSTVPAGTQASAGYVLNAAAARALGWTPEQALGKEIEMDFSSDFSFTVAGPIVGVVEDIHVQSLRDAMRPLVYYTPPLDWGGLPSFRVASVRIAPGATTQTLAAIDSAWRRFNPDVPLQRRFLEADFEALYQGEERQGRLFTLFALLTITLACLGLFGLASYTVERRRKEIGVRKVMGGSVWGIVLLLTNDFSRLVLVANVLAWPLAYVAMNRWLENFAYRINLTPLIFIGSGLIALCIAWMTVGGTAAKAANAKPVLALRYE